MASSFFRFWNKKFGASVVLDAPWSFWTAGSDFETRKFSFARETTPESAERQLEIEFAIGWNMRLRIFCLLSGRFEYRNLSGAVRSWENGVKVLIMSIAHYINLSIVI